MSEKKPPRASDAYFPTEWRERYGDPPVDARDRRAWITRAIKEAGGVYVNHRRLDDAHLERRGDISAAPGTAAVSKPATIVGLAVPFNGLSADVGGFRERIDRHAFAEQERSGWPGVRMQYHHQAEHLLATVDAGTMEVGTRDSGVWFGFHAPALGIGGYVTELVARGDLRGASIGFISREDIWENTKDGPLVTVADGLLREVSVVRDPAYRQTLGSLELTRAQPVTVSDARRRLEIVKRQIDRDDRRLVQRDRQRRTVQAELWAARRALHAKRVSA